MPASRYMQAAPSRQDKSGRHRDNDAVIRPRLQRSSLNAGATGAPVLWHEQSGQQGIQWQRFAGQAAGAKTSTYVRGSHTSSSLNAMQLPLLRISAAGLLRKPLPEDHCEMHFCMQVQQGRFSSGLSGWIFRAYSRTSLRAGESRQNKRVCGCEPHIQHCAAERHMLCHIIQQTLQKASS